VVKQIKSLLPVLLLVLIASVSVLYQFNQMPPPYPWADEAAVGYEANLTRTAGPRMIDPSPMGAVHDPHYAVTVVTVFLAAAIFQFLGPSLTVLRLLSSIMGVISVVVTYLLAREMFEGELGERARYAALAAGGLMAVSLWFLGTVRIGWAPPAGLMLGTVFFYYLWKAVNGDRNRDYVLAGLFLALAQYGHITARFLPFALGAFIILNFLLSLVARQASASLLVRQWRGWVMLAGTALAGSVPLIQYYLRFPEDLVRRAQLVSPVLSFAERIKEIVDGALLILRTFGFDLGWLFSQQAYALLAPPIVILFAGGVVLLLARLSRPQYQFLLVSWVAMSAPAWLAISADIPFLALNDLARRAILAQPITFIIVGLSLEKMACLLQKWMSRYQAMRSATPSVWMGALSLGVILWAGGYDYYTYFAVWRTERHVQEVFSPQFTATAQRLHEISDAQSVFIFPHNAFKDTTERSDLYTIGFLYQGDAPFTVVTNDDGALASKLAEATRGRTVAYLVQKSDIDDPKGAFSWMLAAYGQLQPAAPSIADYHVSVFHLNPARKNPAGLPQPVKVGVPFGQHMQLESYYYGANVAAGGFREQVAESGNTLLVSLSWKLIEEGAPNYAVALLLRDAEGRLITQLDAHLVNAVGLGPATWSAGALEPAYIMAPVPVGLPPGEYWLDVALYNADTLQRETPSNGQVDLSYRLGAVTVLPAADVTALRDRLKPVVLDSVQITPALWAIGNSLQIQGPLLTGSLLRGIVYWQAAATMADDVAADYVLVGSNGSVVPLAQSVLLGGKNYPTHVWRPSEIVADYLSLRIPADALGGEYRFGVRLTDGQGKVLAELPLAKVTLNTWDRIFELPADVSPLAWQLGDSIKLVGARLPQTVSQKESLSLSLFWQTAHGVQSDYVAFVHVLDETGNPVFQDDSVPGQGARPVPGWLPGEVVEDRHEMTVPADAAPGVYRVVVGLYDMKDGKRLPVQPSAGDTVDIGQVQIR
jgi:uncharacterized membrane protein